MNWGSLGSALASYEAAKSPLGQAIYKGVTGKDAQQQQAPQDPGSALANAIHPRYKRGGSPAGPAATPNVPQPDMSPVKANAALDPDAGTSHELLVPNPPQQSPAKGNASPGKPAAGNGGYSGPGGGVQFPNEPSLNGGGYQIGSYQIPINWDNWGSPPSSNGPLGGSSSGITYDGGVGDPSNGQPGGTYGSGANGGGANGGGGGSGNETGEDDYSDFARGGVAGRPQMARVAESGPEMAGGHIVTSPSYVKLEKGEAVVPLTPRAGNHLQPDLLEGHLGGPHIPGVKYSRYRSFNRMGGA